MKLDDYLEGQRRGTAEHGAPAEESDWLDFCQLELRGTRIQVVDASYAADEREGCMVTLAPGVYQIQVRVARYGGDVRISRLRAFSSGVAPAAGTQIGETGTDTANIGIYDYDVFARAWGNDNEASWEIISPAIEDAETHGIAVLNEEAGAVMPFVSSGFGDGTFPVHELVSDGVRVGFEVTFIEPGTPYPFGSFCLGN